MIKSMTGYGRATLSKDFREFQVEIRSVNHRYLDISIKMPKAISYLEDSVKKEISAVVKRGKIDVSINFNNNSTQGRDIKINTELAHLYIKELKELAQKEGILANIEVTEISKFPDVLEIQNNQNDDIIEKELNLVVKEATSNLVEMRKIEGNEIASDLLIRIKEIKNRIKEISKFSTGLIGEYVVKLEERLKELLKDQQIDQARLAQEVVIYADKCSVEEEITRLDSHITQFVELLNSQESVGKKLDFIIQEMNRETNTIGSKANNLEITNEVINIKTQLENIREQIQNIE